ncbi:MAG TPA: cupredoxin domain-containing protein [Usitatibacter sp.]|nr:cupredoxin domain-containing protein [Usitatibacter sp.]
MSRIHLAAATAFAGAVALAGAAALAADAKSKGAVVIEGTRYEPATVTVKRGTTVSFVNKDPFPHTVTAAGVFDSKEIGSGRTWKYKAAKRGRFDYICTLHPNMKGTLVVE